MLTFPDGRVSAVIDWCDAERDGLQVLDVVVFRRPAAVMGGGQELGPQLLSWLAAEPTEMHVELRRPCSAAPSRCSATPPRHRPVPCPRCPGGSRSTDPSRSRGWPPAGTLADGRPAV